MTVVFPLDPVAGVGPHTAVPLDPLVSDPLVAQEDGAARVEGPEVAQPVRPVVQPEQSRASLRPDGQVVPGEDGPTSGLHVGQINHPGHRPQSSLLHSLHSVVHILGSLLVARRVLVGINEAAHTVVHDLIVLRVQPGVGQVELGGQLHSAREGPHQTAGLIAQIQQLNKIGGFDGWDSIGSTF